MQATPKYHCAKCNLAVLVHGENVIRGCKCDAPVVANMQAKAHGSSSMKHGRL